MRLTSPRVIATALALPVLAGVGIAVAPTAIAAANPAAITAGNPNVTCTNSGNSPVIDSSTLTPVTAITASIGDTVTFTNGCNGFPFNLDFIPDAGSTVSVPRTQSGTMTLAAGTTSIQIKNMDNNAVVRTLTVTLSGGGSSAEVTSPAPWLQSFARASAAATCPAGYGASWAEWPNGGKGGFVCNRTLVFDGSAYSWITG